MFINAPDMARFGYLFLNNGKWGEQAADLAALDAMARQPGTARNPESTSTAT